jgi:hypothetical protein
MTKRERTQFSRKFFFLNFYSVAIFSTTTVLIKTHWRSKIVITFMCNFMPNNVFAFEEFRKY